MKPVRWKHADLAAITRGTDRSKKVPGLNSRELSPIPRWAAPGGGYGSSYRTESGYLAVDGMAKRPTLMHGAVALADQFDGDACFAPRSLLGHGQRSPPQSALRNPAGRSSACAPALSASSRDPVAPSGLGLRRLFAPRLSAQREKIISFSKRGRIATLIDVRVRVPGLAHGVH